MRNSKAWFLRACFLLAGILGAYLLLWPAEPSYKGRRLNEWIRSYGDGKAEFKRSEIDEAVRAMGTDAIPFLVRWLQYEPLEQTGKLTAAMSGVIRRLNPSWERREMQFVMSSVSGFRALGPEAARAVGP